MFDLGAFHRIAPKWSMHLHHYDSLDSTNDEARTLAEQGAPHGTVVLADHQVAGRGRRGAVWASDPGDGLLFSMILRPNFPRKFWSRLALASGCGIVHALRSEINIPAEIKWPNDVYISGKKCAGVLVESQDGFAVVGVGLNVADSPEDVDSTSLAEHAGAELTREEVLATVLEGVMGEADFCADNFPELLTRLRAVCFLTGKYVNFYSSQELIHGQVIGIGDGGEFLVEVGGEVKSFQQAELIRVAN